MSLDFPIIYCNGDSYSNEKYHPSLKGKTYANVVSDYSNGYVINKSINGSCNRRIIRTTVHDMILERKLNPTQQIICLLGLSFELRSELWHDSNNLNLPEESQFRTHTFSSDLDWREKLLNNNTLFQGSEEKFLNKYSDGRAFFYSPYAERINLLCDLIMLKSMFNDYNIDFLVFQCPIAEQLKSDHLLDTFKNEIFKDPRFFDFETFGFCQWAKEKSFIPLDMLDRPEFAHYGADAHASFANEILIPKLKELDII